MIVETLSKNTQQITMALFYFRSKVMNNGISTADFVFIEDAFYYTLLLERGLFEILELCYSQKFQKMILISFLVPWEKYIFQNLRTQAQKLNQLWSFQVLTLKGVAA